MLQFLHYSFAKVALTPFRRLYVGVVWRGGGCVLFVLFLRERIGLRALKLHLRDDFYAEKVENAFFLQNGKLRSR